LAIVAAQFPVSRSYAAQPLCILAARRAPRDFNDADRAGNLMIYQYII
jgi:hypothetical protein